MSLISDEALITNHLLSSFFPFIEGTHSKIDLYCEPFTPVSASLKISLADQLALPGAILETPWPFIQSVIESSKIG